MPLSCYTSEISFAKDIYILIVALFLKQISVLKSRLLSVFDTDNHLSGFDVFVPLVSVICFSFGFSSFL